MKTLYYSIEFEFDSTGESKTGNKFVTMYTIRDNKLIQIDQLDLLNEENTEGRIQIYLDDNGYSDVYFDLVLL